VVDSAAFTSAFTLAGRVALITGSARGLGWAMAKFAAEAGAHVILNGRHEDALRARAAELRQMGLLAAVAAFDVTDEAAVDAAVRGIIAEHGRIDVLVNNAGTQNRKAFQDFTADEWRALMDTHVGGAFLVTRAVTPHMLLRRHGRIVMISSIAAYAVRAPVAPYAAAKGALAALVRALAFELGPHGITCNGIAPGFFATDFTSKLQENENFNKYLKEKVPLGRWGAPEEIGPALVFLASAAGSFVNGHILTVDGGYLASG